MKYGNDNVVDAIYSGEKKGNPFLEAMPEAMSTEEVIPQTGFISCST